MPHSNGLLAITVKPKAKYVFQVATILLLYVPEKSILFKVMHPS
jgi:hypothetical protein